MICEQKNRYSKQTAQKVCDHLREKGQKLKIYECKQCGRWHLSHKTNWTNKPRKNYQNNEQING